MGLYAIKINQSIISDVIDLGEVSTTPLSLLPTIATPTIISKSEQKFGCFT